ncbi:Gp49 family protein [Thauera butanivorans]|uniref:Gp49 family protein n=1 Tax=Thauera butanivorans TaxID=86174 RepID=UPI003AB8EDA4
MNHEQTAPRITKADIEANIASEFYFSVANGVEGASQLGTSVASWTGWDHVTLCAIILCNGTKIIGINYGPVSRENFDPEEGRRLARENAVQQIWPLMGYAMRQRLFEQSGDAQ